MSATASDSDGLQEILGELEDEFNPETEHEAFEGSLYHYTDPNGFHGILTSRSVWATDYRFLNDRQELTYGEGVFLSAAADLASDQSVPDLQRVLIDELTKQYQQFKPTQVQHVPFVASFSTKGDLLSQWRAYSADGAGYSIGFSGFPAAHTDTAPAALWQPRCSTGP